MFNNYSSGISVCALPVLAAAQTPSTPSQTPPATPSTQKAPSTYDKLWGSFTEWYRDDSNPIVQRVLLSGRFHYDYAFIDSDQGFIGERDDRDEWNVRRFRIGPRVTLFRTVTAHAEVELDPHRRDRDRVYARFTDLYVQWTKEREVGLTVGQQTCPLPERRDTSESF